MNPDSYDLLLDPSAGDAATSGWAGPVLPVVDLPADYPVEDAAVALEAVFADDPDAHAVLLVIDGRGVGVSTRDRLIDLGSALLRSPGDGDGATLPGSSLHYRILRFHCPVCGAVVRRVHVDAREAPHCPNSHGRLELDR